MRLQQAEGGSEVALVPFVLRQTNVGVVETPDAPVVGTKSGGGGFVNCNVVKRNGGFWKKLAPSDP